MARPAPAKPPRTVARPAAERPQAQPAADTAVSEHKPLGNARAASVPAGTPGAVEASFEGRLLQAVQAEAARRYPVAARLMGVTGQAVVAFEYRDGSVHVTGLMRASGFPALDRAALAAVQDASYPPPPAELAGRTLVKIVHVKFELTGD